MTVGATGVIGLSICGPAFDMMVAFIINTMSSTCSCSVSVKGDPRQFSGSRDKFAANNLSAPECPTAGWDAQSLSINIFNGITMGLFSQTGDVMDPRPTTNQLEQIQEMNASLSNQFLNCRFQFTNCRIQQTQDFLMKQIDLTKNLQKVTDETQNALIAKNMAMTNYAIATGTLILIYVLAIPSPTASFK